MKTRRTKKVPPLKRCPFCGNPAKYERYPSGMEITGCANIKCGVKPEAWGWLKSENTVKIWNKRTRKK